MSAPVKKGAKTQAKNFQEIDKRQPRRDGLAMKNILQRQVENETAFTKKKKSR